MLTFQQIIQNLFTFWEKQGCIIHQGHDLETGAGTFNPATFLRCLGPEAYKTAYVEPSRRPSDGRYGENPNRLQLFHQFQVILKPSPANVLDLYKQSLEAIGLDLTKHDIRFVHDDWESPTLGAYGLGWEVWIDGMEVTQFTYFQAVASLPLKPITAEITYGLERLCMYVQNKDNFFDMQWNEDYTFTDIIKRSEMEWSAYNFTYASTEMWFRHFDDYEREAKDLMAQNLPLPAYDFVIKASHAFNMLDARGVISVTERAGYIARIRDLARLIGASYLAMREKEGFPLMRKLPQEPLPPLSASLPTSFDAKKTDDFLLEIGSEELPATFVPIGMQNLEMSIRKLFEQYSLSFDAIQVFGTPRRLGVLVKGLAEGTAAETLEKKGPHIDKAFDENGQLTKQGAGFIQSTGKKFTSRTEVENDPDLLIKGDYIYATIHKAGRSSLEILANELPKCILGLDFPKKMRWGMLDIEYARPIRWICALYGSEIIPFLVGNVASDHFTWGHAQLHFSKLTIEHADRYFDVAKEGKVLANVTERKQRIEEQLEKIEAKSKAHAIERKKVLSQVLHMTEWPTLFAAEFDREFLEAPSEVLISEMVEHQKYFPLADQNGNLLNHFIVTADQTPNELIAKGNQKVLSARLADGVFLYRQDLKKPLSYYGEKLGQVLFQKKLGSMKDKVARIASYAQQLNESLQLADPVKLTRASILCKADLTTAMVGEFPQLQGTIGKTYALHQGEDPEVASAIEEHWMPTTEAGNLPQTKTGIVLSLADKLDNLISYFNIGLKPTSSSDPYALRRQTIGIIKILIDNKLSLNLEDFASSEIVTYITVRAKSVFEDYGFAKDEIEASGLCRNPYDQYCKIKALHAFRKEDPFAKLFEVYKRAKGQLEKGSSGTFDPALAQEPAEKELTRALTNMQSTLPQLLKQKKYQEAFSEMAKLQQPLAHLFDTVKILDDDPDIRTNRLSLLHLVFSHFNELLDFGKIQTR